MEALADSMSLEEKVGQLFFSACPAQGAAEKLAQFHLGGCLLFLPDFKDPDGNWLTAEAFMDKTASFQDAAAIPLFIGVDEEGGTVARASRNPNLFEKKFRSPREVYLEIEGGDGIRADAIEKSTGLLSYGINVNFAPVADVSTDPADFIYARTYGLDAEQTAFFVGQTVEEMTRLKTGSVLKHFPGYGSNADTHTGIAVDERPYEQFQAEDFLPFRAGIQAGAGSVLVSHNIVNCMDPDLPASLSPEVHRILREELGFTGVMYDGSTLPYEENLANTVKAVAMARKYGAGVEAELGALASREGGGTTASGPVYTDPEEAVAFCRETGIDALAPSFGTAHGIYKEKPVLDLERVKVIAEKTSLPLVMHGGSGVSPEDYRTGIANGLRKINYYSYMSKAGTQAAKELLEKEDVTFFHDLALTAQKAMETDAEKAMRVFAGL